MSVPSSPVYYLFAALPILVVMGAMTLLRWDGRRAGPVGWLAGLVVGILFFGLNFDVFWVSQFKGLLLSLFVLLVLWPALFLYNIVAQTGGFHAIATGLRHIIVDRGLLLIVLAWAFSGMLEGLAGFGIPIAIMAPILVELGVGPIVAVAAVAVGHAWSVTFGDMGVIYQTLIGVTGMDAAVLAPVAALVLGAVCIGCGLGVAIMLGYGRRWPTVVFLGLLMSVTQYVFAVIGVTPLAAFAAGLAGTLAGVLLCTRHRAAQGQSAKNAWAAVVCDLRRPLLATVGSYGALTVLLAVIAIIGPLRSALDTVSWRMPFPEVVSATGFVTASGFGQAIRFLTHPGMSILLVACLSYAIFHRAGLCAGKSLRPTLQATWHSAAPASIGVITMVGLSTLMEHTGMTQLLARGFTNTLGSLYPVASPLVGVIGAFATGSNNNSNVLFAPLQQNVALLLSIAPTVLVAGQTAGGALGSMVAPAKIVVGCSTVNLEGKEGEVLRLTVPYCAVIGCGIGILTLLLAR